MAIAMAASIAGCGAGPALPPAPDALFVSSAEPPWGTAADAMAMRAVESAAHALEPKFGRVTWQSEHALPAGRGPALFAHYRSVAQAGGWTPVRVAPLGTRGVLEAWAKGDAMFGVLQVNTGGAAEPVLLLVNDTLARQLPSVRPAGGGSG